MKSIKLTLALALLSIGLAVGQEKEVSHVLITNVNVWDAKGEAVIAADVLIANNLIKEVRSGIKAPKDATVIDGKGGTLTPGLIDMHTHIMLNGPKAFYSGSQDYDPYTIGA